ncbi:glycosyltransferase [Muricauda sp. SCSIO 64092]|uniref:glycosyltransferase n=1 Tax=Allomuricauda sp. SCSIO 64092 TaxID=2908842 RepID=UPI001FF0EDF8|nr:glycosyltransferase [Muricauda sp. SCSIO 64092]UOY06088.1 glycosyltransferase [Muricauda sp. SCSIO 64092]
MMTPRKNISILDISLTSGGAEKVISLLLKELVNDYNVTLILFYNEIHFPIPSKVDTIILSQQHPDKISFPKKLLHAFGFLFKYHKILRKKKISHAISFLAFPNLINGLVSPFNPKTKTIISERGFPSDNTSSKLSLYISKIFYPLLYNRCDSLFSNSVYINQDLQTNFRIRIPMDVIYNPIELPKETIVSETLLTIKEPFKVINVGTLNERKNQKMILGALSKLGSGYELTVLGSGPEHDRLQEQIQRNGLMEVVFLKGRVKNVNTFLRESHCFVLSSFTEGFPNALLEAMAMGLPCISTNCLSGPHELLHDNKPLTIEKGFFFKASYGILINNDDEIALAKALEYLKNDPQARERYSALSLKRAKAYSLENIYRKFNNFINH